MEHKNNVNTANDLFLKLEQVPVDKDGCLEEIFLDFKKGTAKDDVHSWIEETYEVSIPMLRDASKTL
jgi:hypothetical protein